VNLEIFESKIRVFADEKVAICAKISSGFAPEYENSLFSGMKI